MSQVVHAPGCTWQTKLHGANICWCVATPFGATLPFKLAAHPRPSVGSTDAVTDELPEGVVP